MILIDLFNYSSLKAALKINLTLSFVFLFLVLFSSPVLAECKNFVGGICIDKKEEPKKNRPKKSIRAKAKTIQKSQAKKENILTCVTAQIRKVRDWRSIINFSNKCGFPVVGFVTLNTCEDGKGMGFQKASAKPYQIFIRLKENGSGTRLFNYTPPTELT